MTTLPPPVAPEALQPPKPKKPVNKIGNWAFTFGVGGFALGCYGYFGFVSWIPAIAGVVLGIVALNRPTLPKGMAIWGLVVGVIAMFSGPITAVVHVVNDANGSSHHAAGAASAPAGTQATPVAAAPAPSAEKTSAAAENTVKTKTYTGDGDKVLHVNYEVPVIVSFSCSGCSDNTSVETDSGTDTLIVNTIGAYSGRHVLNTDDNSLLTKFVINANAHWKLKIVDAQNAKYEHVSPGTTVKGSGDDVIVVDKGVADSDVKNVGDGNFSLQSYGGSDSLPVNEIGSYRGDVDLDGPAVVQVESDGSWSIKGNG